MTRPTLRLLFSKASPIRSSLIFSAALLTGSSALAVEKITIPSRTVITPDSQSLVFAWAGDIWTSSIDGGEAEKLTFHPAPDTNPHVSADGKFVFFNSSRTGSEQVFQIPIQGGTPKQITFHSEGSMLQDLHPTEPVILVSGLRDHAGRRPYRLMEKPLDPAKDETLLFDAEARSGTYSPSGKKVLFTREGAPPYRKGYHGSQATQIWLYDLEKETFTQPVAHEGGCRFPVWAKNGQSFYYVSQKSGAFNIWQHRFGRKKDRQITQHADDSVFAPALSADGKTLTYRHLFDQYLVATKGKAKPIKLDLYHRVTMEHPDSEALVMRSTQDATVTPSGLEWAYVAGGEIWAMDTVLKEPNRLTDSPALESDIYFSEDGTYLYYKKDNGIAANYWRMSKNNPEDFWWNVESLKHEAITKGDAPKSGFSFSPDGEMIAYVEYPGTVYLAKPDGSEARKLIELSDPPSYVWSPNGKHLAYSAQDANFNSDIFIVATDGESEPVNISRHPDNEYSPRWSPDGKTLAFSGRRHSTSTDLFFVHLKRDTHFRSERDARIESAKKAMARDPLYKKAKEAREKAKAEAAKKEESVGKKILKAVGLKGKDEPAEDEEPKEETEDEATIDFEDLHKRIQRIQLNGLSPRSLHWMPGSKSLIFQSGGSIYRVAAKAGASAAVMTKASGPIIRYQDNDKLYMVSNGLPAYFTRNRLTTYPFTIRMNRDREQYQRMGFRMAWRTLRDRFYDPQLNNRDWDAVREKYEVAAAESPTKEHFGRVMSMLLGELNASHMGFYPTDFPKQWKYEEAWRKYTPHLGMRLDPTHRVTFVHPNGPADRPASRISVGERLLKIDGEEIRSDRSLTDMLNGRLDRDIVLTVKEEGDEEARDVTIRPISYSQARALAQAAHLDSRNQRVEEQTDGKLGYLHVARMMWDEFEKFEQHIYERGAGKDGLIIDVRDNGGGFTCDHLLTVLTQPLHAYTIGRNGSVGYPQDRHVYASWNKPIVVLCNQNSFSNAEIFSHAIKTLDRGKVVGIPTAGGVISTGSTNILGLGKMRLPFRGWFLPFDGEDMELNGAVPHVVIDVRPGDLPSGNDPQLDKAIEVLKSEVQSRALKLAPAIYNSGRK